MDLLYLIREEQVYARRIRDALVFRESLLTRAPALIIVESATSDVSSEIDKEAEIISDDVSCGSDDKGGGLELSRTVRGTERVFLNSDINRRRTVDREDALYSGEEEPLEFTYSELLALQKGKPKRRIDARTLRRLANRWRIDSKLRKSEMIAALLAEFSRRHLDES